MKRLSLACPALLLFLWALPFFEARPSLTAERAAEKAHYLGSSVCGDCHQEIHRRFSVYSKKAVTRRQVEKLLPKLSGEEQEMCFSCHATGYNRPSGFISYAQTPHLGDVGCESCHGPGSGHVDLKRGPQAEALGAEPEIIRQPGQEICQSCHTPERGGVKPIWGH